MMKLSRDKKYILINVTSDFIYEIPLFTIKGVADIDRWRNHLQEKQWATGSVISEFEKLASNSLRSPFYRNEPSAGYHKG
ncbi:MAG TPA: hypothetical protein DCZ97_07785 [Syntrophus sp. (in: bacteria)]|nr:hypothetical protein [Syntrophus sp. (in: bacteria)]